MSRCPRRAAAMTLAASVLATLACLPWASTAAGAAEGAPPPRTYHTATLLAGGDVVAAGGGAATASRYDTSAGTWADTGPMTAVRSGHTATLLDDGRILVAGGGTAGESTASAELYDPEKGTWTATAPMAKPRAFHTATLLADGRVLVAGGQSGGHGPFPPEAELFDPRTSTWSPGGAMEKGRSFHAAARLADGRVLVSGGQGDPHADSLRDAAVYDPKANTWSVVPELLSVGRSGHTATLLGDGTVLLAGGTAQRQGDNDGRQIQASTELYDPADRSFRPGPPLAAPRAFHQAVSLPSGRVLVVGGQSAGGGKVSWPSSTEVFDPAALRWSPARPLATPQGDGPVTATLLTGPGCRPRCGQVLVVGRQVELYMTPAADVASLAGSGRGAGSGPKLAAVAGAVALVAGAGLVASRRRRRRRPARRRPAARPDRAPHLATSTARRELALLTDRVPEEAGAGRAKRRAAAAAEAAARADAGDVLAALESSIAPALAALDELAGLRRPRLLGKVEEEVARLGRVRDRLDAARGGLAPAAGAAGVAEAARATAEARRLLASVGSMLAPALSAELARAACGPERREELAAAGARLAAAQSQLAAAEERSPRSGLLAWPGMLEALRSGWSAAAAVLGAQPLPARPPRPRGRGAERPGDTEATIVAPEELETFADVGGLEEAKAQLRRTVASVTGGGAAGAVHNGVLLHGPPGTGKTLLARACAGEHGLRYLRCSPAAVASAYQHEPAAKLRQVFERAAEAAPCLLFLDEVDVIGGRRQAATSGDQRELATELLTCLEDYRGVPGLVILAATNDFDHLDPALREGRFDARVAVTLPDAGARAEVLRVHLAAAGDAVTTDGIDLDDLAARTAGRSGAALAAVVAGAAARAGDGRVGHDELVAELEARSGADRPGHLEERIGWDDVVLPAPTRARIGEVLAVFEQPELGRALGVSAPAGVLLYGPPGTGKTTVARAIASQVRASFYECSAAELMSKWAGESEQKVAQLFARARANRPAVIFIDEIDALLRRRMADSAAPWEERVVAQFLRELDGLVSSAGVLVVGATNRPDAIDEAVRDRRLVGIEVPLPDHAGRRALLEGLFAGVRLAPDVDLEALAVASDGMSGADLKALRDAAGRKALARAVAAGAGGGAGEASVGASDVAGALSERGATPTETPPPGPGRRRGSGSGSSGSGSRATGSAVTTTRRSRRAPSERSER